MFKPIKPIKPILTRPDLTIPITISGSINLESTAFLTDIYIALDSTTPVEDQTTKKDLGGNAFNNTIFPTGDTSF